MTHNLFTEHVYRGAEMLLGVTALLIPFVALPHLFF